jgi:magnesium chelatase family protein
MALSRTWSVALIGVQPHLVEVEVDVAMGLPHFILTALSDRVLRHVEHRVRSAVVNSGETWPARKVTVALLPAAVPKAGSGYDLPIALGLLAAAERLPGDAVAEWVALGELSLTGEVKSVPGVLPAVIGARRAGRRRFIVPVGNYGEARLVPDVDVVAARSLAEVVAWLRGVAPVPVPPEPEAYDGEPDAPLDLEDVVGQPAARRAVEVAAAGGHHLYMDGPPGVGKTMLAERLPGLLPDLAEDQAMEVTAVHSVAGLLAPGRPLIRRPPFCAPHHSATTASIVGGGSGLASPGAVSIAHHGVLFLDEAPEFSARSLDALRQPVETGQVTIARANGVATYPCRFQLVLASNPCPCSAGGRAAGSSSCSCTSPERRRYQARLSGPLLDRVDVRVQLDEVSRAVLDGVRGESTAAVRARVLAARERARQRMHGTPWTTNGAVPGPVIRRRWPLRREVQRPLLAQLDRGGLSTRGLDRVVKIAWTLADLEGAAEPGNHHVVEAAALREGYNLTTMPMPA